MRPIFATLFLTACIADAGPLQLRWTAEISDPKPYQAVLFQGETADLQATLKLYGRPVALEAGSTASLWWQTNGMGSAWWQSAATVTTSGVVSATWTPAMDVGADLYRWHIGVANAASSTIYRAFGAFRMQPSPGAAPNILDLPTRWIDFDLVAISNAPWATPADVAEATEGMLTTEADPVAGAAISAHAGRTDNPHGVTAAQIGALTSETDPVALPVAEAAYHAATNITAASIGALPQVNPLALGKIRLEGPSPVITVVDSNSPTSQAMELQMGRFFWGPSASYNATFPNASGVFALEGYADSAASSAVAGHDSSGGAHAALFAVCAKSNWVESIRGIHADIATNVVYHVVVSNGHWLIREVE